MIYKKTFLQISGRSVLVVINGNANEETQDKTELEILVKEPDETDFCPPVGIGHPLYQRLMSLGKEDARQLQLICSGITLKQINLVLTEFEQMRKFSVFL